MVLAGEIGPDRQVARDVVVDGSLRVSAHIDRRHVPALRALSHRVAAERLGVFDITLWIGQHTAADLVAGDAAVPVVANLVIAEVEHAADVEQGLVAHGLAREQVLDRFFVAVGLFGQLGLGHFLFDQAPADRSNGALPGVVRHGDRYAG